MPTKAKKKIDISQVVRWKHLVRRWRSLSLPSLSPRSDGSSATGPARPGFLAVYVGPDRRRFVIPTRFLNYPVFASLLEEAEEEFGFQTAGGLALPCDVALFRWVIDALERDEEGFKDVGLGGFLRIFDDLGIKA